MSAILTLKDISYSYIDGQSKRTILDHLSYEFESGKFYTILGHSGSGKTTLLSIMSGLDTPNSGTMMYEDKVIDQKALHDYRRNKVGIVFQQYNLINYLTPMENVLVSMAETDNKLPKDTKKVAGKPLSGIIGTPDFPVEEWKQMQQDVTKGGAKIIELRGRSSFQSPAYLSVEMIRSAMGGEPFRWPASTFVNNEKYKCIMMAMKTTIDATGCHYEMPTGTADELASLDASYEHLCKMRDELVTLNIVPPVSEWTKINPNL